MIATWLKLISWLRGCNSATLSSKKKVLYLRCAAIRKLLCEACSLFGSWWLTGQFEIRNFEIRNSAPKGFSSFFGLFLPALKIGFRALLECSRAGFEERAPACTRSLIKLSNCCNVYLYGALLQLRSASNRRLWSNSDWIMFHPRHDCHCSLLEALQSQPSNRF